MGGGRARYRSRAHPYAAPSPRSRRALAALSPRPYLPYAMSMHRDPCTRKHGWRARLLTLSRSTLSPGTQRPHAWALRWARQPPRRRGGGCLAARLGHAAARHAHRRRASSAHYTRACPRAAPSRHVRPCADCSWYNPHVSLIRWHWGLHWGGLNPRARARPSRCNHQHSCRLARSDHNCDHPHAGDHARAHRGTRRPPRQCGGGRLAPRLRHSLAAARSRRRALSLSRARCRALAAVLCRCRALSLPRCVAAARYRCRALAAALSRCCARSLRQSRCHALAAAL